MTDLGITDLGLFLAAVLLLNATPGPDTAYIVGRSVAQGRAAGLVSALGISLGCCAHSVASALGLTAILAASPGAFLAIRLAGGAYLVWLGARLLLSRPHDGAGSAKTVLHRRPLATVFRQAFVTNLLNPKVILFFLSFFPQFVRPDAPHRIAAFLLLGALFVAMSTVWNSGTALLAGTLARRAARSPRIRRWLERLVGAAFVGLGLRLAAVR